MTTLADLLAQKAQPAADTPVQSTLAAALAKTPVPAPVIAPPAQAAVPMPSAAAENKYIHAGQPEAISQAEQNVLRMSIDGLRAAFGTMTVGQNLVEILQMLKSTPALKNHLLPQDVAVMVRAIRESYGQTATRKTENKGKTAKRKAAEKDALNDLANLEFTL